MKFNLKLTALLLCVLLILPAVASCAAGNVTRPEDTTTEGIADTTEPAVVPDGIPLNISEYKIIRPDKTSSFVIEAAMSLNREIGKLSGNTIDVSDDWVKKPEDIPSDACEILVGATNRPASTAATAAIGEKLVFSITRSGSRIVIAARNDSLIPYAVDYFVDNFLTGNFYEGAFYLPETLNYVSGEFVSISVVDKGTPNYQMVMSDSVNNGLRPLYEQIKTDLDTILKKKSIVLLSDLMTSGAKYNPAKKEILLGDTAEPESAEALSKLKPNEYGIFVIGNKICAIGATRDSSVMAANKLVELLSSTKTENSDGAISLSLVIADSVIYTNKDYIDDYPGFTAGKLTGCYDCGDKTLAMYYDETTASDYSAYRKTLEGAGYSLVSEHTAAANSFASYKNDNGQIYVAFNSASGQTRITAEPKVNFTIPTTAGEYTAVTTPSVTLLGLDYPEGNTNGMGIIFRLSDGSFIIYDGGFKNDSETIYAALNKLNVTGKKPVIRMWLLTHMHGDHISAIVQFAEDHAKEVELQYAVFNCASNLYDPDAPNAYIRGVIPGAVAKFAGARTVKIHPGTVIRFADAEIEILQTHESLYPATLNLARGNDTSVVSRVKLGGQTVILSGDMQIVGGNALCATYGEYLASDFVQVSHHGSITSPTTIEYYTMANAKYALFPGSQSRFNENKTTPENQFVIRRVGLGNIFIADNGGHTIELPYKK